MTALVLSLALVSQAQAGAGAPSLGSVVERDPAVEAIGKELRCPVCQGMPIGESPSEMAQAMMQRVREMRAEGKSTEEIKQYFVGRYGEWVLLAPKTEGFSGLVWILPPMALLLALIAVGAYVSKGKQRGLPTTSQAASSPTEDPYLARVRRGLDEGEL